jgi:excisionase family DNA binding protein
VKKTSKIRSDANSHSASDAAALLGVSIPTLKRMVKEGTLESFRTPGGHLRILAESIQSVREPEHPQPRPVRGASAVLQNRRERLEELTLDAQELRARREIERLRREEAEEAERREAEAEEREQEAAEQGQALALERARLERQQTQERERRQAEQQLAAFHCRWLEAATAVFSEKEVRWLSAAECKEILDALEVEIKRRTPEDEPRMLAILRQTIAALVDPIIAAHEANKRRRTATERALWRLSVFATDSEKAQASEAVRKAVASLPDEATDTELRAAAERAIRPVQQGVEKRLLDERLIEWAIRQLPWSSNDLDKAHIRRECAGILAELPPEVSEFEAKGALQPKVSNARKEIEDREARKRRQERKADLIRQGIAEISHHLWQLRENDEITVEEYCDQDFNAAMERAVEQELEQELSGDETTKEVRELAHEIIDSEIE